MSFGPVSIENLLKLTDLWVFGYGSLIWNPSFEHEEVLTGYIEDFSRKFWQGNTTHRGRPGKSRVWGRAFRVLGEGQVAQCLDHLGVRECTLGGYEMHMMTFVPHISPESTKSRETSPSKLTLTFVAVPQNDQYLGPASVEEMADCLLRSEGPCGRNLDYMLGIIEFLRYRVPRQELVFEREILNIERKVWLQLKEQGLEMVDECRGFYLVDVGEEDLENKSQRDIDWKESEGADKLDTFTPLLDAVRRIEFERNAMNCDCIHKIADSKSESSSAYDSDSIISTSPPSSFSSDPRWPSSNTDGESDADGDDSGYISS